VIKVQRRVRPTGAGAVGDWEWDRAGTDTQATAVLATSVRTMMKTLSAAALLSALAPQVVANDNGLGLT
jgi:hypothetical protein